MTCFLSITILLLSLGRLIRIPNLNGRRKVELTVHAPGTGGSQGKFTVSYFYGCSSGNYKVETEFMDQWRRKTHMRLNDNNSNRVPQSIL